MRRFAASALAGAVLATASAAQAAPTGDGLALERVVLLMRHSVRPPTKAQATPQGTTAQPWSSWSTPYGELTEHGRQGARLMGAYARTYFGARGLIPRSGCAEPGDVVAFASGKSRSIETAKAYVEMLQPGCGVEVAHPVSENDDPIFHPLDSGASIDGQRALAAARRLKPGLEAETRARAADFAVLQRVLGCDAASGDGCGVAKRPSTLKANEADAPDLEGALSIASTAGQTVLLEYVEGKPMSQVGWGRASKADIQAMLRFHPVKFFYETRSPYVAQRAAAPIARKVLSALAGEAGSGKITLLAGHDTNIAALGGFLDAHFTIADYPRDDPPPGGAMGFELLSDSAGKRYVRAFFTAQSMGQLRELQPLTVANPPAQAYFSIPGCQVAGDPTICSLETFVGIVRGKLDHPAQS